VQSEGKDHGKQLPCDRYADGSASVCPTVPAVTPNLRRDGAKPTKYSTRGVLHDFIRSDEDFGRV